MTEKIQSLDINFHLLKEVDKPFIQNFTSGNIDLDNFFHNEVFICTKYAYITSYCVKEKGEIIALFTLSNDSIVLPSVIAKEEFIEEVASMGIFKEYSDIFRMQTSFPAINIGHLAVRKDIQGSGIGSMILAYVINTFSGNIPAGCQFITVDALNNPNTNKFYIMNGFTYQTLNDSASSTRRMYLPINIVSEFDDGD